MHASHAAQVLHEYRAPSSLQLVQVPQGVTVEDALAFVGAFDLAPPPRILITGSLYLAGEVLALNGTLPA